MNLPTTKLPFALYRAEQVRELDRIAIEDERIPGLTLMGTAGEAAYLALREHWPGAQCVTVVCGTGNNGGDGYVLAARAREDGLDVRLIQVGEAGRLRGDALAAAAQAERAGVKSAAYAGEAGLPGDVVVDAVFGTGLDREVEGRWREVIGAINASGRPVLAIDIPSGLHADTGAVLGAAVVADLTVTFIGLKQGLFTGEGPECCGRVLFHDLDVPERIYARVGAASHRVDLDSQQTRLPVRRRSAHKGHFGHVLVVGGDYGYAGAARMAGEAAARTGAGLVSIATRPGHAAVCAPCPELMCHGIESEQELGPLLDRITVVAVGPGLGRSDWAQSLFNRVLAAELPLVVDADALNLLSERGANREHWVLTPHPGEAARLLGWSTARVQADRFAAAAAMQARYGGVVVLKGAGTLVRSADGVVVCDRGNPGMASGGMGDVLTGIVAGLLAQGLDPAAAARVGVCLHAGAADLAARDGERGLLASDLFVHLRRLVNPGRREPPCA